MENQTIKIGNNEYLVDSLDQKAKELISDIILIENEIKAYSRKISICNIAKATVTNELQPLLENAEKVDSTKKD